VVPLENRNLSGAAAHIKPLAGAGGNFPMALDAARGVLAVVARSPSRLVLLDTKTGNVTSTMPTCGDADDVFFDTKRGRALGRQFAYRAVSLRPKASANICSFLLGFASLLGCGRIGPGFAFRIRARGLARLEIASADQFLQRDKCRRADHGLAALQFT